MNSYSSNYLTNPSYFAVYLVSHYKAYVIWAVAVILIAIIGIVVLLKIKHIRIDKQIAIEKEEWDKMNDDQKAEYIRKIEENEKRKWNTSKKKLMATWAAKPPEADLVEVMACEGGCIGGPCVIATPRLAQIELGKFAAEGRD